MQACRVMSRASWNHTREVANLKQLTGALKQSQPNSRMFIYLVKERLENGGNLHLCHSPGGDIGHLFDLIMEAKQFRLLEQVLQATPHVGKQYGASLLTCNLLNITDRETTNRILQFL